MISYEVTVRIRVLGAKCEDVVDETIDAIYADFPNLGGVEIVEVVETPSPTVH